MRHSSQWPALIMLGLAVIALTALIGFSMVTEARHKELIATIEKPESVAFHELLTKLTSDDIEAGTKIPVTPELLAQIQLIKWYQVLFEEHNMMLLDDTWYSFSRAVNWGNFSQWSEDERHTARSLALHYEDLAASTRELAFRGGPIRALDFAKPFSDDATASLATVRNCVRLLSVSAFMEASRGNDFGAADNILASLKLANAVGEEPSIISQLVQELFTRTAVEAFQDAFPPGSFPPEMLPELIRELIKAAERQAFTDAVRMDVFDSQRLFELVKGSCSEFSLEGFGLWMYCQSPWLDRDEDMFVGIHAEFAQLSQLPLYEVEPLLRLLEKREAKPGVSYAFSEALLRDTKPVFVKVRRTVARHEAHLDLMRMGIALEQYREDHGTHPSELQAIAANFHDQLPVDPFTGDPYHYTRKGDTFRLYSVGSNLKDDGGWFDYKEGDIVWRASRPPSCPDEEPSE